jgi:DNA-directed RNA polymerase subunit RPC12/RpoP
MIILKEGRKNIKVCGRCGCEFVYKYNDLIFKDDLKHEIVKCPDCGYEIPDEMREIYEVKKSYKNDDMTSHAKAIKEYCASNKSCQDCQFSIIKYLTEKDQETACKLRIFYCSPSQWDI